MNNFKNIQVIVIIIMLVFTTKFFQSTPMEILFFQLQAVFLGITLLFLLAYVVDLIVKRKSINKVVLYFIILILFIPIYSAYRANIEFGQPYFYGLASQRGWLLLGTGVWVYYMLITRKITIPNFEKAFLFMAFSSMIIFTLFVLFFDVSQLGEESKFIIKSANRGLRFKFQYFFITFGSIYFFIKYFIQKKPIDFFLLLVFLAFTVLVIQGRTYIIYLAITFLLYYYFNSSFSKFSMIIIKNILFLTLILVIVQMITPEYIEKVGNMFMEMFTVLGGEESKDMSSNARIWTSKIVVDYFHAHPVSLWFGSGQVSHQWNNGYERLFGYFYPPDIGILGGLFIYGIFGIIILLIIPLILEIKEIKEAKDRNNIFISTIKYMLILSIVKFIQGGGIYFGANIWIVLFFILYGYNQLEKEVNNG